MGVQRNNRAIMIIAISAMLAINYVNGLYFYLAKGEMKCFKDELIRNSEVQASVQVVDDVIKDYMTANANEGIQILLENAQKEVVLNQVVKSHDLIKYQSKQGGEFKLCVKITDPVFDQHKVRQTKVILKFSNEYYKLTEEQQASANKQTVAKKLDDELINKAATVGQFMPLQRRVEKITKVIDDIIAHQDHEREREQEYKSKLQGLAGSFSNLVMVQILIVIGAAAYSVINLRKFFVKKHIF